MRHPLFFALSLLVLGCPFAGDLCTEIGCYDFYEITVVDQDGSAPGDLVVSAVVDGQTLDADCPADTSPTHGDFDCGGGVIVLPHTDSSIELSVETIDGTLTFSGTLDPVYDEVFPNGEDCEPVCQQGRTTITLVEP